MTCGTRVALLGVFVLGLTISVLCQPKTLNICAFNIQIFGPSKMDQPQVVAVLVKILLRYDIVLIEEIRDRSDTAIHILLQKTNAHAGGNPFKMRLSGRLGRTSCKEQYAFFYRSGVSVVTEYQYPESKNLFERPPFVVKFRFNGFDFGYLGIHTKPSDAVGEIDRLTDVYVHVASLWGLNDIILGGDFNAACNYVRARDWPNIRLWTQKTRFLWIIDEDTTVAPLSSCAYDRFVLAGNALWNRYQKNTAKAFKFDVAYGLTPQETKAVSDHYPIEMQLVV